MKKTHQMLITYVSGQLIVLEAVQKPEGRESMSPAYSPGCCNFLLKALELLVGAFLPPEVGGVHEDPAVSVLLSSFPPCTGPFPRPSFILLFTS